MFVWIQEKDGSWLKREIDYVSKAKPTKVAKSMYGLLNLKGPHLLAFATSSDKGYDVMIYKATEKQVKLVQLFFVETIPEIDDVFRSSTPNQQQAKLYLPTTFEWSRGASLNPTDSKPLFEKKAALYTTPNVTCSTITNEELTERIKKWKSLFPSVKVAGNNDAATLDDFESFLTKEAKQYKFVVSMNSQNELTIQTISIRLGAVEDEKKRVTESFEKIKGEVKKVEDEKNQVKLLNNKLKEQLSTCQISLQSQLKVIDELRANLDTARNVKITQSKPKDEDCSQLRFLNNKLQENLVLCQTSKMVFQKANSVRAPVKDEKCETLLQETAKGNSKKDSEITALQLKVKEHAETVYIALESAEAFQKESNNYKSTITKLHVDLATITVQLATETKELAEVRQALITTISSKDSTIGALGQQIEQKDKQYNDAIHMYEQKVNGLKLMKESDEKRSCDEDVNQLKMKNAKLDAEFSAYKETCAKSEAVIEEQIVEAKRNKCKPRDEKVNAELLEEVDEKKLLLDELTTDNETKSEQISEILKIFGLNTEGGEIAPKLNQIKKQFASDNEMKWKVEEYDKVYSTISQATDSILEKEPKKTALSTTVEKFLTEVGSLQENDAKNQKTIKEFKDIKEFIIKNSESLKLKGNTVYQWVIELLSLLVSAQDDLKSIYQYFEVGNKLTNDEKILYLLKISSSVLKVLKQQKQAIKS